jgi:uncharacterized membrane protein
MENKSIDFNAAIKTGWNIAIKNWLFFTSLLLFLALVNYGESFLENLTMNHSGQYPTPTLATFALHIIFFFLSLLIGLGLIKIALEFVKGGKPKFLDIFSCLNLLGKYFVAELLIGLFIMLPIFIPMIAFGITFVFSPSLTLTIARLIIGLLGIAGTVFSIYFGIKFMLAQYFIVDKNSGIIESLKLSSAATKGVKWQLILLTLILLGIMLLGFIALFIGLFIAVPVVIIASTAVYLQLAGQQLPAAPTEVK